LAGTSPASCRCAQKHLTEVRMAFSDVGDLRPPRQLFRAAPWGKTPEIPAGVGSARAVPEWVSESKLINAVTSAWSWRRNAWTAAWSCMPTSQPSPRSLLQRLHLLSRGSCHSTPPIGEFLPNPPLKHRHPTVPVAAVAAQVRCHWKCDTYDDHGVAVPVVTGRCHNLHSPMHYYRTDAEEHAVGTTIPARQRPHAIRSRWFKEVEDALEAARPSGKPKRMESVFVFEDLKDAKAHVKVVTAASTHIYRVKARGIGHRGDMNYTDFMAGEFEQMLARETRHDENVRRMSSQQIATYARNYWRGQPKIHESKPVWEILCREAVVLGIEMTPEQTTELRTLLNIKTDPKP